MSWFVPTSPLAARARYLLQVVTSSGQTSARAFTTQVMAAVRQLLDTIGRPLLRVRPMVPGDLPYMDDYAAMVDETRVDLTTLVTSCQQAAQQGVQLVNFVEARRQGLDEQCATLAQTVAAAEARVAQEIRGRTLGRDQLTTMALTRWETYIETFADTSSLDSSQSQSIEINTTGQSLTLRQTAAANISARAQVSLPIVTPANTVTGIPGNNLEADLTTSALTSTLQQPEVAFIGDGDNHSTPSAMLDANPNSWFEFERCSVNITQPVNTVGVNEILADVDQYLEAAQVARPTTPPVRTRQTSWTYTGPVSPFFRRGTVDGHQPLVQIGDAYLYSETGTEHNIRTVIAPDTWRVTMTQDGRTAQVNVPDTPSDGILRLEAVLSFDEPQLVNYFELDPYISARAENLPVVIARVIGITADGAEIVLHRATPRTRAQSVLTSRAVYYPDAPVYLRQLRVLCLQPTCYTTYIGHVFYLAIVNWSSKKSAFGITYSSKSGTRRERVASPDAAYALNTSGMNGLLPLFGGTKSQSLAELIRGVDVFRARRWAIGLRDIVVRQLRYAAQGTFVSRPYTFQRPISAVRLIARDQVHAGGLSTLQYTVSRDGVTWLPLDPTGVQATALDQATSTVRIRVALARRDTQDTDQTLTPVVFGYELQGLYTV